MNRPSLDMRGFLTLFPLFVYVAFAVPFATDDRPWMTIAPKLLGRDVQSICGFWTDVVTTSDTWSYWCNSGLNCDVDMDVTPQIVFCSTEALIPYTAYYSYGQWPAAGCQYRESCCPIDAPKVRTHTYNNGASLYMECAGVDANITDGSQSVYTQLGEYSVFLAPYSTTGTASAVTKTTASPAGTVAVVSATSSHYSTIQSASSITNSLPSSIITSSTSGVISSPGQSTISQTTTFHTTSSTTTVDPQSNTLGFKIGLGSGLGLGIPLVLVTGIFAGMWTMRKSRSNGVPGADPKPVATQAIYELGSSRPWDELDSKPILVNHNSQGRSELDSRYRPYELDSTR